MAAAAGAFPKDVTIEGKVLGIRGDIGEDLAAISYLRLKQEGSLGVFFHNDVSITLTKFLEWAKKTVLLGCFYNPSGSSTEMVGGLFINKSNRIGDVLSFEVGEFFHRGVPPAHTEAFAKLGIAWCFDVQYASVIYGVTPVENRAALIFNRRLGFRCTEPLPYLIGWHGKATSGIISYLTRARWEAVKGGATDELSNVRQAEVPNPV